MQKTNKFPNAYALSNNTSKNCAYKERNKLFSGLFRLWYLNILNNGSQWRNSFN